MKKRAVHKLITAIIIAFVIILYPAQNKEVQAATTLKKPQAVVDSSMKSEQKVTWDCVWFGSYPQSEVTSGAIYDTLRTAKGWDSNNDITVNGVKYRRLKGEDAVYTTNGLSVHYNWNKDYSRYHYFKYEPIKWRVLSVGSGKALLLADYGLDDQKYNVNKVNVTWERSSIRSWLNGQGSSANQAGINYSGKGFINNAFSTKERNAICATNIENANSISKGTYGGNNTTDKVFLLADADVCSTQKARDYGFVLKDSTYDEARRSSCSTYSFARGTYKEAIGSYKGNSWWWLRSPGDDQQKAACIFRSGGIYSSYNVDDYGGTVRPSLYLNLSASDCYSYAGTVASDGSSREVAPKIVKNSGTSNNNKTTTKVTLKPVQKLTGKLSSVKSTSKAKLKITWKKANKVTGYQIQISIKKNFKSNTIQRYFKQKESKTTIYPLKRKKKYYVRIRPYQKIGSKKYYGKWSAIKSAKTK